ncbi:CSMD [Mytilus edulis]|uniref:CSMD n=1 Tax=Mytilus edulis TaxID=6550 RepID=A0A8S3TG02_MYTED|nr:CSMD [Mytilus edulis]
MTASIKISGYHFGNNITFQCVVGYSLSGPPFITCHSSKNQSMGQWSSQQPLCLALPCPSLKLPMHSLNKHMKESQMYYVDQNVDFKCEKGYNLIGNGTYKCTVKSNSSIVDWNYEDAQTCLGMFMLNVSRRMKREGKSATVYEDMQFKTVERQNGSNDETYTELT